MTPSMGMAAPKGMAAAPQAGLAAIAQPAQAPKGMSSGNMAQVMALARKMSDAQLAEVLQGKSLDVPQYVAMTEAMGRKSLRTAMQGQQAMAQAQQPSVKQKLLMGDQPQMQGIQQGMPQMPQQPVMAAEGGLMYADGGPIDMNMSANAGGGIAELPAPNMDAMTMAGGGIVAFADTKPGTETEMPIREDLTDEEKKQLAENPYMQRVQGVRNLGNAFVTPRNYDPIAKGSDILSSIQNWGKDTAGANAAWDKGSKAKSGEIKTFTNEQTPKGKLVEAGLVERSTPINDVTKVALANEQKKTALTAADAEDARTGAGMTALLNAQKAKTAAAPVDTDKRSSDRRADLAGNAGVGIDPTKRANPFEGLKAELPDYVKVKNQGLGEGLMALSGAMFGTPNLSQAFAKGLPALAQVSGATRKEVADLKKEYNAQQLSLGKANELFESGQEDLALKKLTQSQNHAYHMQSAMAAMLQAGKPSDTVQTLQAIRKPGESMSDAYGRLYDMRNNPKEDQALKLKFADYQKSAMGMVKPLTYDQWLSSNGLGGATMANNTGNFSRGVFDTNNRQIQ
jgi:hypothetical protein